MKLYLGDNVFDAALKRIAWLFDEFPNVVVDFSGGKDSTVVLNLALRVAEEKGRLPLTVSFLDQEAEWQSVIDYMRIVMADSRINPQWFQFPFLLSNATSSDVPFLDCWAPGKVWMREKEPIAITENPTKTVRFHEIFDQLPMAYYPEQPGVRLAGMRCSESPGRAKGLTASETYKGATWGRIQDRKRGHYVMNPIYDWEDTDVWKAIHSNGWPYCNTAEAPIWMGDFSFKPVSDVKIGDIVIGFTEPGEERSTLTRSTVIGTQARLANVQKITLESGRVLRCTANHRWLRNPGEASGNWRYGLAQIGDFLAFVIEPWQSAPLSSAGAWLGGMYDGEGCDNTIAQSRSHNPEVCARLERAFEEIGVPLRQDRGANATKFRIAGGRDSLAKFVDRTRPVKAANFDKLILTSRYRTKDRIVSIELDGHEPVYALQTTTENYIAWGYASSNCAIYDAMFQHGIPIRQMRVSNLHHETAVHQLYYLQEVEADTWERLTQRLSGINSAGQLKRDAFIPESLPWMFRDWAEYRDHLVDNLITDPKIQEAFRKLWRKDEGAFDPRHAKVIEKLHRTEVAAVLANDWEGTKVANFRVAFGWALKGAGTSGALRLGRHRENWEDHDGYRTAPS